MFFGLQTRTVPVVRKEIQTELVWGFFARKQVLIVSAVGHAFFLPQKDLR